jgi:nucleoside-diphosphate-sugar epimerase
VKATRRTASILVTGGTGFLGLPLVEGLLQQGQRVRVLGRRPVVRWRHNPCVEHIRADIAEPGVIEATLEGITHVYHLAAATQGTWATYQAVTVDATARLFECLVAQGGGRMVFVSSLGNYDGRAMQDGSVVDEHFPCEQNQQGRASYARAKVEAERIAQRYLTHPTLGLTIVRPGIVYGPGMKNPLTGVVWHIGRFIRFIPGRGDKPLPLIYIEDAVRALVQIIQSSATIGSIYNLVHPELPTQNAYLRLYRQLSGDRRPVLRLPLQRLVPLLHFVDLIMHTFQGGDLQLAYKAARLAKRIYYSGSSVTRDTGFKACVGLEEGLHKMFSQVDDAQYKP